ncbi:unnamed protein product [Hymenolepis diminuta]|uniref:Uncharacterized protein n=1 Tax=Hymenolepis diminuta TaxID=6216 RepID=A0A564Z4D6_HYMDI|nr:unnamed protein product [Hymenolepis diminuta]
MIDTGDEISLKPFVFYPNLNVALKAANRSNTKRNGQRLLEINLNLKLIFLMNSIFLLNCVPLDLLTMPSNYLSLVKENSLPPEAFLLFLLIYLHNSPPTFSHSQ